ncbi:MAG TPA: histidinol dehydrogenase [Candidatus Limnocylindrales bacterium]|nr:histidinol dehydrogenase [Candidatus Limnocylindrales bacterium]
MTAPVIGMLSRVDWTAIDERARREWLSALRPAEPATDVAGIIEQVRQDGDAALRRLTERFDGVRLGELWVSRDEFDAADATVDDALRSALVASAEAVRRFHSEQQRALLEAQPVETHPGVRARRRFRPLRRAGGYIPGGRAPLASSVVMLGVPAALAGVGELVLATPPRKDGRIEAAILVAARLVGVRRILKVGGAQAIAALAYGTESVPPVDRIFGAGNGWVTAAKRSVSADVAVDLPAGPSEAVVLADADAEPRLVAIDLLAQAEHGPDSIGVLVTDAPELIRAVERELEAAVHQLATGAAAAATLRRHGFAVLVDSLDEGLALVDEIAPEHASLQCAGAPEMAERLSRAGAVFVGGETPIAAGDYAAGTNHVLPTGGAARAWSGVGVEAFGRWMEVVEASAQGVAEMADTVSALAEAEGMAAHRASVLARLTGASRSEVEVE